MNKVTIQPTIFENHPQGTKTFGYRMYDDYGQTYLNTWESIPDDDIDILTMIIDSEDEIEVAMINHLLDRCQGLFIGDEWYEWDQIKHLFDE
jgi:hypothetical protein